MPTPKTQSSSARRWRHWIVAQQLAQIGLHPLDWHPRAVEQVVEHVLVGLGDPQRADRHPPARLDATGDADAHAGGDVVTRRRFERAGAVAEHQPARLAGAHHQDLIDLLAGVEVANAHEDKP